MSTTPRILGSTLLIALSAALAACGQGGGDAAPGAGAQGQMPPLPATVITVQPQRTDMVRELPGRLEATRVAEVRARVTGIVKERAFTEGTDVKGNQLLFKIDDAPLRAAHAAAQANVQQAEANLFQAAALARRLEPLAQARAVSQQEYDQAVASHRLAQAQVAQQRAALEEAKLNLGYATVTAPIEGRIGNALVTEGALVSNTSATPMALVQQIDPIYVNITQSANELLELRRAIADGALSAADDTAVTLVLTDGSTYAHPGKLLFSGVAVDPGTGQVTLRAEFPNPNRELLPGMYVRSRITQGIKADAMVIPPQAVQRNSDGTAYVYVVNEQNQATIQPIKTGAMVEKGWIIDEGLKAGDRVITDRFQQLRPGAPVQATAPGQSGQGAGGAQGGAPQGGDAAAAAQPAG